MVQLSRFTFIVLLFPIISFAQQSPVSSTATIQVTVTNSKKAPIGNEEVLFVSTDKKNVASGKTNASGKFSLSLPAGNTYTIILKTLTDSSSYSTIDIPSLEPGQFFEAPFKVAIEYEPPRKFTLHHVLFDTGKPTLRPESFRELNEIAEYMSLKKDEKYEISGHTDNVGKPEDNLKLSQQRAESVRTYLVHKGISASRIIAKGYGDSMPVADNNTTEGKQKNRRTEVRIQ